jgi:acyl-CoA thioesterase-1
MRAALLLLAMAAHGQDRLPRVLLIGDSISIGYTAPVQQLLAGKARVYRIPGNGGPTTNGLAKLDQWLAAEKWDLIHFNFGLHDLKIVDDGSRQVPLRQYETNLREISKKLMASAPRVIWASTTPVPRGKLGPPRNSSDVPLYNEAAARVMSDLGIPTNDLYAFMLPRMAELQLPQNVHFTSAGYEELAKQVAGVIAVALAGARLGDPR